ncbi:DUF2523 domain-containing protein [Ideonella sp.]|uniref:DUF2523 domain-containing protein n=1 Tax=Ideonella sp. TaxID=1929293 RepID=UPI00351AB797
MSWADWLIGMIQPLITRALVVLGMGVLTYTGVDTAIGTALSTAQAALQGLPIEIAQIVARFGFFDFMSITSGGVVSGIAWLQLKKFVVTSTGTS